LLSTARDPDEQAAAEKCAHTLLAALCGAHIFTNAGFLANDEYISPAQVVIDNEIVEHVRHVIEGLCFGKKEMALSAIREVIQNGSNFIEHETTIQNYRSAAWDPSLFSHIMVKASGDKPVPSVWERAREQARKYIRAGDFVIPESDRKILDSIYRRVEEQVIQ
jgi:trimethylamine:corrinoid methyltransferase-like protein